MMRKPLSPAEKSYIRNRRRQQCRERFLKAACIFCSGVVLGQIITMIMAGII